MAKARNVEIKFYAALKVMFGLATFSSGKAQKWTKLFGIARKLNSYGGGTKLASFLRHVHEHALTKEVKGGREKGCKWDLDFHSS